MKAVLPDAELIDIPIVYRHLEDPGNLKPGVDMVEFYEIGI